MITSQVKAAWSHAIRRPDLRAARIEEVVELLAAGVKQRPRS
jgi:hypothetical protein